MTLPWRTRDVVGLVVFSLLWLVPVTYHGLVRAHPLLFFPRALVHLTNISCLFTYSIRSWWWFYAQVQTERGGEWVTLDEDDYFRMRAFGFHSRLDEAMRREMGQQSILELTDWIRKRFIELNPDERPPTAVRIMGGRYRVGEGGVPHSDRPILEGRWSKPPLETLDEDDKGMWYQRSFDG